MTGETLRSAGPDELMARPTAAHPARHLEASGYVVMKRPPAAHHGITQGPTDGSATAKRERSAMNSCRNFA